MKYKLILTGKFKKSLKLAKKKEDLTFLTWQKLLIRFNRAYRLMRSIEIMSSKGSIKVSGNVMSNPIGN